ncbi:MAG: metallophosphoesterase [Phycisphaerales bacterium]|nr:metallophosphoesterase [Phycisphaerales bacterium]
MSVLTFKLLLGCSVALDCFLAAWILLRRRHRARRAAPTPIGLQRVLLAALLVSAMFAAKFFFAGLNGRTFFPLMSLANATVFFVIPFCGLAVLLAERIRTNPHARYRASRTVRAIAIASLLLIPVGVYGFWIEPYRLVLETADVPLAPLREGREPVRIAVLADIQTDHVGDHERRAIARVMQEKPDLILLPGDLFQGTVEEFNREEEALRELMSQLEAPGGAYFVFGNTDERAFVERALAGTPVRLLENEIETVTIRDRRIAVGGVEFDWKRKTARQFVQRFEQLSGDADVRILLTHLPDILSRMSPDSRIDLVVAGHTHGGQVVIPGFGPPVTFTIIPRDAAAGGLHTLDGKRLYISRGIGLERGYAPRVRFLCPPEVSLLTLATQPPAGPP